MPNNITVYGGTPHVDDFQTPIEGRTKTPEESNYLRILYKPGVSVQARELNQMQSMVQSQIDTLGRGSFQDGATIAGGEKQFDDGIYAVDINIIDENGEVFDVGNGVNRKHFLDNLTTLQYKYPTSQSASRGDYYINATVLSYVDIPTGEDSYNVRFFIRYDNSYRDDDGIEYNTFPDDASNIFYGGVDNILRLDDDSVANQVGALRGNGPISSFGEIDPNDPNSTRGPIQQNGSIGTVISGSLRQAIVAKVDSGIFFVKGEFVLNDEQSIYFIKPVYDYLANGKLAFRVVETVLKGTERLDLQDNSAGYPNSKAPGADRYTIDLQLLFLSEKDIASTNDEDFINNNSDVIDIATTTGNDQSSSAESYSHVLTIEDGKDRTKVADVLDSNITNVLARRTEEESGDYAVEPFVIDIREYYNDTADSENRGLYTLQQIKDDGISITSDDISGLVTSGSTTLNLGDLDDSVESNAKIEQYGESRFSIGIEPSVAYVEGFRIEATERIDIPVEKARRTEDSVLTTMSATLGSYIESDTPFSGIPSLGMNVVQGAATAKVRGIEKVGTKFRLYLYNIAGVFVGGTNPTAITGGSNSFSFTPSSGLKESDENESFITLPYENIESVLTSAGSQPQLRIRSKDTGSITSAAPNICKLDFSQNDVTESRLYDIEAGETYLIMTTNGDVIIPDSATFDGDGKVLKLNLPSNHGLQPGSYDVMNTYTASLTDVKTKTSTAATKTFSEGAITSEFAGLGKVDVYEIVSAKYFSDTNSDGVLNTVDDSPAAESSVDITSEIELDDGQRDGIYKESKIRYLGGVDLSDKTVIVTFKHFTRGAGGDFYSKNSYNTIDYKDIPSYNEVRLSDILDFRGDEDITDANGNPVNDGLTTFFDPNSIAQATVNYYLNRIDVVVVNTLGEFKVITGTPALYPDQPSIPDNAMHLYTVNVPAYTFDIKDIENDYIDNRRYTMRDIGELESRIKNIEYYQTMSLLENDANEKQINDEDSDGSVGMERFKNGIVVDSFLGHGTADTLDPGYAASVDKVEGLMRPSFEESNNRFILSANSINSAGIQPDGMATLDMVSKTVDENGNETAGDEVAFINQDQASVHMSVNPYAVAAWWGEMKLSPSSDQWKETRQRPDIVVNRGNDASVLNNIRNAVRAQGTQWGSWRTNWVGRFRWRRRGGFRGRGRASSWRRFGRRGRRWRQWLRYGLRTTVSVETVRRTVNNKIVDTSFVPFIRSRRVYFTGKLFRPNTTLHLYFDGVDISSYATKAPFVEFKNNTDARNFLGRTDTQIFKTLTGNTGREELVTDDAGSITGYFVIPNNSEHKFRTGEREVILSDSSTGAKADDSTTSASVEYSATGVIQHTQRTVVSTRRVRIRRDWVFHRRNVRVRRRRRRWRDPLAQSFMIGEIETGVYATSVDLYFQKKSNNVPVQMYIVTTDNGYPSQEIIPGSEVTLMPEDVNIDSTRATAATNFRFESPVYLSPGVEYAIVVLSNDDNYRMWLSDIGKEDVTTEKMIVKNPYTGVMFKSQNASTWTADQNKDFKFKLNRADFKKYDDNGNATVISESNPLTKVYEFDLLRELTDDSPQQEDSVNYSQLMLQAEEVNLPQTSIRYQLSINNGAEYVDVTPGEEYYRGGTIDDQDANAIKLKVTMTSSSPFITPLLDLDRLALAGVRNIINSEGDVGEDDSPDVDTELNANHGTAEARYITQEVNLANPADKINTYLDINRPIEGSNVRVYIRTKIGEESILNKSFVRVLPKNDNEIPINADPDEFEEVEFQSDTQPLFSSFQVKIVMTSNDTDKVPVIKSLRSIATT
jgi:hypothetical protein